LLDIALERNIVGKSGSWWTYGETRIGQGRENAKVFLEEHSDIMDEIEALIRNAIAPTEAAPLAPAAAEASLAS